MIARIWRGRTRADDLTSDKEARFPPGGDRVPARCQVIIDPRRARLYADLRRRFPLRIAALR